jgi:hypothetical protein
MAAKSFVAEEKTLKSAGRSSEVSSELGSLVRVALQRLVLERSSDVKENSSFLGMRADPTGEPGATTPEDGSSLTPDGYFEDAEDGVAVLDRLIAVDPERLLGEEAILLDGVAFNVAACTFEDVLPRFALGRTGSLRGARSDNEEGWEEAPPALREALGEEDKAWAVVEEDPVMELDA